MGPTVLLCDESMFTRMIFAGMIQDEGYEVIGEATSGDEAVREFALLRPRIVIMDLVLPGINGIEATRRIRRLDRAARILICSANAQECLVDEVLAAGASAFLEKPPVKGRLLQTLATLHS